MAKRLEVEAASLPEWAKLLEKQESIDHMQCWDLRVVLRDNESIRVLCSFPTSYPFVPPSLQLLEEERGTIVCQIPMIGDWSPALRATDVLDNARRFISSAVNSRRCAEDEIEKLRSTPPPWLLRIGDLRTPPWVGDEDVAIAEGRLHERQLRSRSDWERIGAAQATQPVLGPWRVHVIVSAEAGSNYDCPGISRGIRVRLTIGRHFPHDSPRLSVCSTIVHLLGATTLPQMFYQFLAESCASSSFGIRETLEHFRRYLKEPLPCLRELGLPYAPQIKGDEAIEKWNSAANANLDRFKEIAKYSPFRLHSKLFEVGPAPEGLNVWARGGLSPALVTALNEGTIRQLAEEVAPGIFAFEMFTESLCDELVAEFENYERIASDKGWRVSRPNSMNNHGVILTDIGLEPWVDALQVDVLGPISAELYPDVGAELDRHHAFLVEYEPGRDLGLDMHTDDSDVTFNVCLGKSFSGGGLLFCGILGEPNHRHVQHRYQHRKGHCLLHLGLQRHGADDVVDGQRRNLIIWNVNDCYRSTHGYQKTRFPFQVGYKRESAPPDKLCVSRTHDRDAAKVLEKSSKPFGQMPWCPPFGFEAAEASGYRT